MFKLFSKKQPQGETILFKIDGMHCTSCSLSIDGELEDTPGVLSATTSYAKAETQVLYDPERVSPDQLQKVIEKLGYRAAN